jgi:hypothetical protein
MGQVAKDALTTNIINLRCQLYNTSKEKTTLDYTRKANPI